MFRVGALAVPPMYFLYNLAIVFYAILVAPRALYAAVRYRKYIGSLAERCGWLSAEINPDRKPSIWIHAVSVGEVLSIRALIPALRDRYPGHRLLMSTTTETGRAVAAQLKAVDGLFYFPLDLPVIVKRVLARVRPDLFLMVDTELWPNLLRHCARLGVKTVLVNGRISDRSYPRYLLARSLFRRVLVGVDRCCAQSETTSIRLIGLGASPTRVTVTGNLKFDVLPGLVAASSWNNEDVLKAFRVSPGRTVLIAASTHSGEESFVLDAFARIRQQDSQALLVVAPRHPERCGEVTALSLIKGFETVRRSDLPANGQPRAAVVVLDTVGELAVLYQIASIVFLGGSLVPVGGHNVLEPASWGKPVVFGPHMRNFSEITELFLANRAARQISGADGLEVALLELLDDSTQCASLGAAAANLVRGQGGATERSLAEIAAVLPPDKTGLNRGVEPNSCQVDRNGSSRF